MYGKSLKTCLCITEHAMIKTICCLKHDCVVHKHMLLPLNTHKSTHIRCWSTCYMHHWTARFQSASKHVLLWTSISYCQLKVHNHPITEHDKCVSNKSLQYMTFRKCVVSASAISKHEFRISIRYWLEGTTQVVIVIGVSKHVFVLSIQYLPTSKEYLSMTSGSMKLCRLAI